MANIPDSSERRPTGFSQVVDAFLLQPGLPFAEILSAERIERIFAKHGNLFGVGAVYSTAVMVWAFLGQVLRDGKEASCRAAVAHVVTHCIHIGTKPPTSDTGDYCRARAKLSFEALRDITREVAAEVEQRALPAWLFVRKLHAKLIDGTTITMPDTPENQSEYPHPKTQTAGVGLPIARIVTVLSLATGCIIDAAIGPYKGKKTGDPSEHTESLESSIREHRIELRYEHIAGGADGLSANGRIVINPDLTRAETFTVLVHEFAHEILHTQPERRQATNRTIRETEAEAVAHVVCRAIGMDCSTRSVDYIQLYRGDHKTLGESLEHIQKAAAVILDGITDDKRPIAKA